MSKRSSGDLFWRHSCPEFDASTRAVDHRKGQSQPLDDIRNCDASNRHTISIELMIFVVAALAGAKVGEIVDKLDRRDPLDHLEA